MVFLGFGGMQGGGAWGGGGDSWDGGGKGYGKGGFGGQWQPDVSEVAYALQVMNAIGMPIGVDQGGAGTKGCKGSKGKGKSGKAKQQQPQSAKKKKLDPDAYVAPLGWKTRLINCYAKEHKDTPPKGFINYETSEAGDGQFMCTLTCEKFATDYTTMEVYESKKEAEEAVAEAAARGEFPQHAEAAAMMVTGVARKAVPQQPAKKQKAAPQEPAKKQKNLNGQLAKDDLPWKSKLQNAWGQENKQPQTKGLFTYTSVQGENGSWMCTLTSESFSAEYSSEDLCESKKLAEEAAAMAALQGEYPAAYAAAPAAMRKAGASGVKRKAPEVPAAPATDSKSVLNNALMMLAERGMVKDDIVYTVTEVNDSVVASVKINCLEGKNPVFKGKAVPGTSKESKKQAQYNAAAAALKAFKAEIEEKTPEWEVRKAARKEEHEAKQAAKRAGLA